MEATYITPGICNFSYIMTSQVVKTILFFNVYSKTNNLRCKNHENRIIFQNLTPVELKIAKGDTFDLFDYNAKTIYHRYAKLYIS